MLGIAGELQENMTCLQTVHAKLVNGRQHTCILVVHILPNEIAHNGSLYPTQMYQREQIAKTIRVNSFDEIAVVLPAVNPADGRMPREYSMYIYYSLFSFLNGIQQWVIMQHITEYELEKLKYWFRLLLNHINSINTLWPTDAIWRHRSGSTLAQAMACCLMAPSHYLNQC